MASGDDCATGLPMLVESTQESPIDLTTRRRIPDDEVSVTLVSTLVTVPSKTAEQQAETRIPDECGGCDGFSMNSVSLKYDVSFLTIDGSPSVRVFQSPKDVYGNAKHSAFIASEARAVTFLDNYDSSLAKWFDIGSVNSEDLVAAGFFRYSYKHHHHHQHRRYDEKSSFEINVTDDEITSTTQTLHFNDHICCFMCGIVIHRWLRDENPLWEHLRRSPQCSFAISTFINSQLKRSQAISASYLRMISDKIDIITHANDITALWERGSPPRCTQYRREIDRTLSFFRHRRHQSTTSLEQSIVATIYRELVRCGFYYVGPRDKTRCFACGIVFSNWTKRHKPAVVHAIFSAYCPMVRGIPCGNEGKRDDDDDDDDDDKWGGETSSKQHDAAYALYETRRRSFGTWWLASDMADAGFYYIASDDRIQCYRCKGTIVKFHEEHLHWTPKQMHDFWFPRCK